MYTNAEINEIRNYERLSFRFTKKLENKNRKIPNSDDILYMSDFSLKKFLHDGDSGELYIATNKKNNDEKYIIKHEYYDSACNEYMYSKIGNKMGIKIAPVKLFILDDKEDKFKSDFVCGIKYFENSEHISLDDVIKNSKEIYNYKDYFKFFSLESLFEESDGIEVIKYNNEIYRLDMTAAFTLSTYFISMLAYDYKKNGININDYANKFILERANQNTDYRIYMWENNIKNFIQKYGYKYLDYYIEPFKIFESITENDIEKWTNNLTILYPNIIGEYYKKYFINLKLDLDKFFEKINIKEKTK